MMSIEDFRSSWLYTSEGVTWKGRLWKVKWEGDMLSLFPATEEEPHGDESLEARVDLPMQRQFNIRLLNDRKELEKQMNQMKDIV